MPWNSANNIPQQSTPRIIPEIHLFLGRNPIPIIALRVPGGRAPVKRFDDKAVFRFQKIADKKLIVVRVPTKQRRMESQGGCSKSSMTVSVRWPMSRTARAG